MPLRVARIVKPLVAALVLYLAADFLDPGVPGIRVFDDARPLPDGIVELKEGVQVAPILTVMTPSVVTRLVRSAPAVRPARSHTLPPPVSQPNARSRPPSDVFASPLDDH